MQNYKLMYLKKSLLQQVHFQILFQSLYLYTRLFEWKDVVTSYIQYRQIIGSND